MYNRVLLASSSKQLFLFYRQRESTNPDSIQTDPLQIFLEAVENCKPIVGVRGMNRGGKVYQVINYSTVWVLLKKKKRKEKKRKKALYFSVKVFSTKKLFCVVMRATRRSNRLQYK